MIEIIADDLVLVIDEEKLNTFGVHGADSARQVLADVWEVSVSDLLQYQAAFYDNKPDKTTKKKLGKITDEDSFVTLSFISHGYIADANEFIDSSEAKKQIEIDLEIINRESQWSAEESIYFDEWWPSPTMNDRGDVLEFGVALKDYQQKTFNRTLNRIILTRFGHLLVNYSLSEQAISYANPLSYYQAKLDEACSSIQILEGYRYQDVDEDNDMPSRSRLVNLILSSEIF